MTDPNRVAGTIEVSVNDTLLWAKGSFTWHLGTPKRDDVIGADKPHGYTETQQMSYIEGVITNRKDLNAKALFNTTQATVVLDLGGGKQIMIADSWFSGEGTGSTEAAEIPVKFSSALGGEEIGVG